MRYIVLLITVAGYTSTFAYAVADIRWWVPLENSPNTRELILFMMHALALIAGPAIFSILSHRAKSK